MSRDWEEQFREWAKRPGKTEQDRSDNAASAIRNAIKPSDKLCDRRVSFFAQGSYRNNTNVRQDSDVDIGVLCEDTFLNQYPEGTTKETFGFSSSDYRYKRFKDEVEEALVSYLGRQAVKRTNKAFDVHETSYHVEADLAAFLMHRRYQKDGSYFEGVALLTDKEKRRIINWPEQHYRNGVKKNSKTGHRYKGIVRVLKSLSVEMTENRVAGADIPGFLIECMTWNVLDERFQHSTYTADVHSVLVFLFNNTLKEENCKKWVEVSGLKWLFGKDQKWTCQQAHAFTSAA